jgi:hypothetical protein
MLGMGTIPCTSPGPTFDAGNGLLPSGCRSFSVTVGRSETDRYLFYPFQYALDALMNSAKLPGTVGFFIIVAGATVRFIFGNERSLPPD